MSGVCVGGGWWTPDTLGERIRWWDWAVLTLNIELLRYWAEREREGKDRLREDTTTTTTNQPTPWHGGLVGPCVLLQYVFGAHSGTAIGPEGGKALAVPLAQLTALQQLNLRCSNGKEEALKGQRRTFFASKGDEGPDGHPICGEREFGDETELHRF
jgi:hypothetical protein